MITLDGTIQRRFFFPADPQSTLHYFGDLGRIVFFLPHIQLTQIFNDCSIRVRYESVELGAYTINVYCDLTCEIAPDSMSIRVKPFHGAAPFEPESTLNTTTGHGLFTSEATLFAMGEGTGIDFCFRFQSRLPRPRGLRMMPKRVVDRIADSVSQGRMEEMIEGFMASALDMFPAWYQNQYLPAFQTQA